MNGHGSGPARALRSPNSGAAPSVVVVSETPRPAPAPRTSPPAATRSGSPSRTAVSGALLGVGLAGFVDEAVFHQILHWHHFYDRSTLDAGLVSDGFFHAFTWFATVAGLFLLGNLRHAADVSWPRWWGGVLAGAGAFQLYDGLVHHKLLRLHQVRYGVELTPYDVSWNLAGAVLLAAGVVLLLRTRRPATA